MQPSRIWLVKSAENLCENDSSFQLHLNEESVITVFSCILFLKSLSLGLSSTLRVVACKSVQAASPNAGADVFTACALVWIIA